MLGAGNGLPPLLLDDDSAVAVAIELRTVAADPDLADAAVRAAAVIDQVLPSRLRRQVEALTATTVPLGALSFSHNGIAFLARACQSGERLRFGYRDGSGKETRRHVEPYRLVSTGRRWYLVARDVDKGQWRSFRLDRLSSAAGTGVRSRPADPPDAAAFVSQGLSSGRTGGGPASSSTRPPTWSRRWFRRAAGRGDQRGRGRHGCGVGRQCDACGQRARTAWAWL